MDGGLIIAGLAVGVPVAAGLAGVFFKVGSTTKEVKNLSKDMGAMKTEQVRQGKAIARIEGFINGRGGAEGA
ncbi:MAG: hypothetical protein KAV87_68505 [Desulfobacteraceae bacterium]|nr:hypothetical protein [Desulfobacteraceae bacterium]